MSIDPSQISEPALCSRLHLQMKELPTRTMSQCSHQCFSLRLLAIAHSRMEPKNEFPFLLIASHCLSQQAGRLLLAPMAETTTDNPPRCTTLYTSGEHFLGITPDTCHSDDHEYYNGLVTFSGYEEHPPNETCLGLARTKLYNNTCDMGNDPEEESSPPARVWKT